MVSASGSGPAAALAPTAASAAARPRRQRAPLADASRGNPVMVFLRKLALELPPGVQTFLRTTGVMCSTLSTLVLGGAADAALRTGVAPSWARRRVGNALQRVWVDAVAWLAPPLQFCVTGELPGAYTPAPPRVALAAAKALGEATGKRLSSGRRDHRDRDRGSKRAAGAAAAAAPSFALERPPTRLLVMNRMAECDVLLVQMLAHAIDGSHGRVKALLSQHDRQHLFALGNLYEIFGYCFLSGSTKPKAREVDRKRLARFVQELARDDTAYEWVVLFPERGFASQHAVRAQAEGAPEGVLGGERPALDLLLQPDAAELEAVLRELHGTPSVEVFDLTFSYEGWTGVLPATDKARRAGSLVPNYNNLLRGSCAASIHVDSVAFVPSDITEHAGGVQGWLDQRWARKDALLRHFKDHHCFPVEAEAEREWFESSGSPLMILLQWFFNLGLVTLVAVSLVPPRVAAAKRS
jgi:hypothetical protein